MRIIIIGGSGLIGGSLYNLLKKNGNEVIATYHSKKKPNMTKFNILDQKISEIVPNINNTDIFLIMSACSNPSWIYDNKELAYKINVSATIDLIKQLIERNAKIFFMSSVEIFDGKENEYFEDSKSNPLNYYGKTKVIVEEFLKKNYDNQVILRTGWNVGINKESRCVVSLTYKTLLSKNARMAFDNSFTITHVEDLASAINKIIFKKNNNIYHLSSSQIVKRTELADFIIKNSKIGKKMFYKKVPFSEIKYSEPRSRFNHLRSKINFVNKEIYFRPPYETILEKVKFLDNLNE